MRTVYLFGGKRGLGHWARAEKLSALLAEADPHGQHWLCTYEPLPAHLGLSTRKVVYLSEDRDSASLELRDLLVRLDAELLIIDNRPEGPRDLTDTVNMWWLRRRLPSLRVVLATRDILDSRTVVSQAWRRNDIHRHLQEHFQAVWCFGDQAIYDISWEYGLAAVDVSCHHLGYLPPVTPAALPSDPRHKVVITAGGGGDGSWLPQAVAGAAACSDPESVLVTLGPQYPQESRATLISAGRMAGVHIVTSIQGLADHYARANLVISMAGYNTVSECLWSGTPLLVTPRVAPAEQLTRARRLSSRGLLRWTPGLHADAVQEALDMALDGNRPTHRPAASRIRFACAADIAKALADL